MVTCKKENGIAIVEFNDADSGVNTLSYKNLGLLKDIIRDIRASGDRIKGVFFTSAKENIFIAGADIKELVNIKSREEALELCKKGQDLFNSIEELKAPTFAVIDGVCIGGGLELALACSYILATENKRIKVGLPEVKLGIVPGFGGPCRLTKRIGPGKTEYLLKTGTLLNYKEARRMRIVDRVILESEKAGYERLLRLYGRSGGSFKRSIMPGGREKGELERIERETLAEMILTEPAKNALSSYGLISKYKSYKWMNNETGRAVSLRRSLVIGAGTMGRGIAYLISSGQADASVDIRDIDETILKDARKDIGSTFKEAVKIGILRSGEARQRFSGISFAGTGSKDKDLIIESVTEDAAAKKRLFKELEGDLSRECIVATNTSCISVEELAGSFKYPERFLGVHFFNPAYKMKLVEVVPSSRTSRGVLAAVIDFLRGLKRIPVIVKDSPGFLVNRMLLPYLNEAVFMLEEGFSGQSLDKAMLGFGMPMGPVELIKKIGPDVTYKAAKILESAFGARMKAPDKIKRISVKDGLSRKRGRRCFSEDEIVNRLLRPIKREARLCMDEGIVGNREVIDLALLLGIGFPIRKRIWSD